MRVSGSNIKENNDINVYKLLNTVMKNFSGEVGGHPNAAGCIISKLDESKFLEDLKKSLEIEEIKVAV
jgi:nanoRNase/pAp phosphatase (c-di-AMP/oligoRNAs hydrolase)